MRLHERTGTIASFTRSGRPIVTFDYPLRCCGEPDCSAHPTRQAEVRFGIHVPAGISATVIAEGVEVRTWWETRGNGGGLAGEVVV
jgi:hypothetical protein